MFSKKVKRIVRSKRHRHGKETIDVISSVQSDW